MHTKESLPAVSALDSRAAKTAGVACLVLASITGSTTESPAQGGWGSELASLDNLEVVIVDDPDFYLPDDVYPRQAKEVVDSAGEYLEAATDGAVTTPQEVQVHEIAKAPSGQMEAGDDVWPCFTEQDLLEARSEAFKQSGVDRLARTAIIANGSYTCYDAAGVAYLDKEFPLTVYNTGFSEHLVLHEEGHVEGIDHSATIYCPNEAGHSSYYSKQDAKNALLAGRCFVPENENGEHDEYSNELTVMGSRPSDNPDSPEFYNFVELNRLAPEAVPVESAGTSHQEYVLSLFDGDLRGVKIDLPEGHPLQTVDGSIDQLAFGLDVLKSNAGDVSNLRVMALGEHNTYDLDFASGSFIAEFDNDRDKETIVYTDETLGIAVKADAKLVGSDGVILQKTVMRIEPLQNPAQNLEPQYTKTILR